MERPRQAKTLCMPVGRSGEASILVTDAGGGKISGIGEWRLDNLEEDGYCWWGRGTEIGAVLDPGEILS